jgi:hypothetical protein
MFVVLLVARSNGTRPVPAGNVQRSTKVAAHRREISPERFPAKWIPVRVKKTLQNNKLEHNPEKCEAVFRKDHAQSKT